VITIPKIIHYCWFGKQPKPDYVNTYIAGWKKVLPDYRIIEWTERNFNVDVNQYVRQAYKAKKYAFVSDYARLYAIFNHGGIYLDTDVEVRRPFDDLLENDVVLGFEQNCFVATSTLLARKHSIFIKDFMDSYNNRMFVSIDDSLDLTTNVQVLTKNLTSIGLNRNNKRQRIAYKDNEQVLVVEQKYLSPFDYNNNICHTDSTTLTIHHFSSSWSTAKYRLMTKLEGFIASLIGMGKLKKIRGLLKKGI